MKKVYLVDSENVGDVWVPLLASSLPDEEVVVFYTQQSPHMGYENVRLLKETEKNPIFIKCFEGRNALDFQLVTELGYRLRADEECEYVIISTDTGFDAAVRYWSSQKKKVRRLNGKECFRQATGRLRRSGADIEKISMEESTKTEEVAAEVAEKTETETGFKMAAEQLAADAAELAQGAAGVPEDTELAEAAETTEVAAEETGAVSTQEDTVMESANEQPEKTRSGARRRRRRETRKQKVEVAEAETEAAELSSEAKTSQEEAAPPEADAKKLQPEKTPVVTETEQQTTQTTETEKASAATESKQQATRTTRQEKVSAATESEQQITQATEPEKASAATESKQQTTQATEPEKASTATEPKLQAARTTEPEEMPAPGPTESQLETAEVVPAEELPDMDATELIVTNLFRCIQKDNLADFHNAMVMFLGEEDGKRLYLEAKNSPECNAFWAEQVGNSQKERFDIYCKMVFAHSEPAEESPEDFAEFLWKANGKRKNLNSLRAALQAQYGKDKGMKYYSLFKSHIKIMNRM